MRHRPSRFSRSALFWFSLACLVFALIYGVISYAMPYAAFRRLEATHRELAASAKAGACAKGDRTCQERLADNRESAVVRIDRILQPFDTAQCLPEFADALRHADGTPCFLLPESQRSISDDELKTWLHAFGERRYYEMLPFFLRARGLLEKRYHPEGFNQAMIAAAGKLKWRHLLFGERWRAYNTLQRFLEWFPDDPAPETATEDIPEEALQAILPELSAHGALFQLQNLLRLLDLAKQELTLKRLETSADAVARYRADLRAYPQKDSGSQSLDLSLLIDASALPEPQRSRWKGPYLAADSASPGDIELHQDFFGCPLVATITADGATISSLGNDCAPGGEGVFADVTVAVNRGP